MNTTLQHPPTLVARAAMLDRIVEAGLDEYAAGLLSVAALDLLAEQARTTGRPELAIRRAMESASLRLALGSLVGADVVEECLAALRHLDLDILAARLCSEGTAARTRRAARITTAA